jgi:hypothetical protein
MLSRVGALELAGVVEVFPEVVRCAHADDVPEKKHAAKKNRITVHRCNFNLDCIINCSKDVRFPKQVPLNGTCSHHRPPTRTHGVLVKFEAQLYKTLSAEYLLSRRSYNEAHQCHLNDDNLCAIQFGTLVVIWSQTRL